MRFGSGFALRYLPVFGWIGLSLTLSCNNEESPPEATYFFTDHVEETRGHTASASAVTLGDETRLSLVAPLGSKTTFTSSVPVGAKLIFGIGVALPQGDVLPARVEFRIQAETGNRRETVFSEIVPRYRPNQWEDREVDLRSWSRATVRFTFETQPLVPRTERSAGPARVLEHHQAAASWGNPVLSGTTHNGQPPFKLILISIDCLRADHVGFAGYSRDTTPRLDELAARGTVFDNAVSAAPETLPSHTSMLTGMPPSLHGATKWHKLPPTVPFLPEILAGEGFQVDAVVTGAYLSQSFGFERGFHTFRFLDQPGAEATIDAALDLLQRAEGQDQFLLIHLFDPHWPYRPPRDLVDKFGPRPTDISGLLDNVYDQANPPKRPEEIEEVVNLYDAEVFYSDREIGRFLDAMRSSNLLESAFVLVVGDHGEAFFEHELWQHTLTLYEEMIRVPLLVKWPGAGNSNRIGAPTSHMDLFPTILKAAGIDPPPSKGQDLRELAGSTETPRNPRLIISEGGWRTEDVSHSFFAFRAEPLKYLAHLERSFGEAWSAARIVSEELYDLHHDPQERFDLKNERRADLDAFRESLRAYLIEVDEVGTRQKSEEILMDKSVEDRLRRLGYIR